MKTQNQQTSAPVAKTAKALLPMLLATGAVKVETATQASVHEVAELIQKALSETKEQSKVHANIQSQLKEAIESSQKSKAEQSTNSKLGFLQKVVTLDCFFGGSNCLFQDKKSMMAGEVTEFAKKKIETNNQKDAATILSQVKSQVAEVAKADATAKNKEKEAQLNKQLKDSVQGLIKLKEKESAHHDAAPANHAPSKKVLVAEAKPVLGKSSASRAQEVKVPIDEVDAIGISMHPTFGRDELMSTTLKQFRKVIGYDTFNSILRKDRDEVKDPNDYYNVTVSMLIKRNAVAGPQKVLDQWNGGQKLAPKLDKGFPYDDGDNSISDRAPKLGGKPAKAEFIGKLNGENMTKAQIKNLVTDKTQAITEATLVQLAEQVNGDKDNVFKLMDANVTKGQMKNLITDKPAPITVKLVQTSGDADNVFKLMDANVTKGNLKNLITDKPAPITVKLAQVNGDKDNVFKLMDANVTKGQMKNLITDKPAPITVKLAQTSNPVYNPPFNNWSVNQPSVPHQHGATGDEDLQLRNIIIDGVNGYDLVQTKAEGKPLDGTEDLGQNIIVDGHAVHFQKKNQQTVKLVQGKPLDGSEDLGQNIIVDGHAIHFQKKKDAGVKLAQVYPLDNAVFEPGNFDIKDRDFNNEPQQLIQLQQVDNQPGVFRIVDEDQHQSVE